MKAMNRLRTKFEQLRQARSIHGGIMNMCAAAVGVRLARLRLPSRRLRRRIYTTVYGKRYDPLDESELDRPLVEYPSLNSLFIRGVRAGLRPIADLPGGFVCPCDSTVQEVGPVRPGGRLVVKGVEYNLATLLAAIDARVYDGGQFGVFFLSPRDCHRVFFPQDGLVEEVVHVPGHRLLVHPPYQRREYPVFELNERVVIRLSTRVGECALVMVAGWGVGHITLPVDLSFRPRARQLFRRVYDPPLRAKCGDWLATFELGSTVILVTEAAAKLKTAVMAGDRVRYGQPALVPVCPGDESACS
jgi:phosphatidylserine decarboxylase